MVRILHKLAEEKNFERRIVKALKQKGAWILKTHGGVMQRSGIPDLLCCVNGMLLCLELKASNGRVSELQKHNICEIRKSGGLAFVVYPEDFEAVMALIDRINAGEFFKNRREK